MRARRARRRRRRSSGAGRSGEGVGEGGGGVGPGGQRAGAGGGGEAGVERIVVQDTAEGVGPGGGVADGNGEAAAGVGVFAEDGEIAVDAGDAVGEGLEQREAAAFGEGGKGGGAGGGVEAAEDGVVGGGVMPEAVADGAAERADPVDDRAAEMGIHAADEPEVEVEAGAPERGADIEEKGLVLARFEDADAEQERAERPGSGQGGGGRAGGEVGAEGEDPDGRDGGEVEPAPVAEQFVAAGAGDGPEAVEAGEGFQVGGVAGDAVRPDDVRELERDGVVEDGGEAAGAGVEPGGETGALVDGEEFGREKPVGGGGGDRFSGDGGAEGAAVPDGGDGAVAEGGEQAGGDAGEAGAVGGGAGLGDVEVAMKAMSGFIFLAEE